MQRFRRFWRQRWGRGSDTDRRGAPSASSMGPGVLGTPTKLIVGLGNPGEQYASTRHNIGFRIVELLADRFASAWRDEPSLEARVCPIEMGSESCLLIEPQRMMNRSGGAIQAALARWPELDPPTDLLIIYDDMDLPTGRLRLRPRGGSGGHRGIGDILHVLESKEVPRLRVGVGHPGSQEQVVDWVLKPFSSDEEALILPAVLVRAGDAVEAAIRDGVQSAMGQFNSHA